MGFLSHILNTDELNDVYIYKGTYLDVSDRLNWQITVNILLVFTFFVSNLKNFVNKIISCAVPIYFSDNQEEYANQVCYISNKYFVDDNERVIISQNFTPEPIGFNNKLLSDSGKKETPVLISYYIWVPYILLLQAFLFVSVKYIWLYLFKNLTNLDIKEVTKSAEICKNVKDLVYLDTVGKKLEISKEFGDNPHLNYLITELNKLIYPIEKDYKTTQKKRLDKKLCFVYIIIKMFNFLSIFTQIVLIKVFLQTNLYNLILKPTFQFVYDLYPKLWSSNNLEIKIDENDLIDSKSAYLPSSIYFPLKSMCIFRIRELEKTNSYAVMCSLPINLFIQYMFVFFSIWYIILLVLNGYYILKWLQSFRYQSELNYIKEMLIKGYTNFHLKTKKDCNNLYHITVKNEERFTKKEMKKCKCDTYLKEFFNYYLNSDLVFLLKILNVVEDNNFNNLIQQILMYHWKFFIDSKDTVFILNK